MQVRLLGPVDVALDGAPRPVNGLRRKAVLAALALHDGEVVSTDWLVDVVWGESAPPTVVNSLQTHISYLRGVLGGKEAILARPPGYLLNLGGDGTDARAAERLLRQGYTDSLRHVQHAHDHYQAAGQRVGQARVLNGIGWLHAKLGDYRRALS
ncbi:MAG TPA: winged helix-turn-helix domain-containing protein, partial [Streptosporangiaceae bacterium]|nr:winged helix-turn-helix domain-containing protein [Streptosporangiaceae bacterium]